MGVGSLQDRLKLRSRRSANAKETQRKQNAATKEHISRASRPANTQALLTVHALNPFATDRAKARERGQVTQQVNV